MRLSGLPAALARFSTTRPRLALTLSIAVFVLAGLPAIGVRLDTDFFRLLPSDSAPVQQFRALTRNFGSGDQMFVLVEAPTENGRVAESKRALGRDLIDELSAGIESLAWTAPSGATEPMAKVADGRPAPGYNVAFADHLVSLTWLLLDEAGVEQVVKRLNPRIVARALEVGAGSPALPQLAGRDPLRLWTTLYIPYWQNHFSARGKISRDGGYLVAQEGRFHLLSVRPTRPAQEQRFSTELVAQMQTLRERSLAETRFDGFRVHFLGGHFIAAADFAVVRSSTIWNAIGSFLGVLVLFAIAYRNASLLILIVITLAPATLAAIAVARIFLGSQLSLMASGFAAVLVGLGVDFVGHLYGGYLHALSSQPEDGIGSPRARAAATALTTLATSLAAGCLTSVAAFLVLAFSDFRGLKELGVVTGVGLTFMLVQLCVAVPAFLTMFGPWHASKHRPLEGYGSWLVRRRRWVVGGLLALCAWMAMVDIGANHFFVFDPQPRNLRPSKDPLFDEQRRLCHELGIGLERFQVVATGASEEQVADALFAVARRAVDWRDEQEVALSQPLTISALRSGATVEVKGLQSREFLGPRLFDSAIGLLRAESIAQNQLRVVRMVGEPTSGEELPAGAVLTMRPVFKADDAGLTTLASPSRQRQALELLREGVDWNGIGELESGLSDAERRRFAPFFADLARMRERCANALPLLPSELAGTPLSSLVDGLYRKTRSNEHIMTLGFEVPDLGRGLTAPDVERILALDQPAQSKAVKVAPTGMPTLVAALQKSMLDDFRELSLVAGAAVVLILIVILRNVVAVAVSLFALGLGVLLMVAFMHAFSLRWNLMNLAIMPIILGIGIDNAIFFVNALQRNPRNRSGVVAALRELTVPLLMTSANNIVGFGSLVFSSYRGLQSMGIVASIGLSCCLFVALVVLPALALVSTHRAKGES